MTHTRVMGRIKPVSKKGIVPVGTGGLTGEAFWNTLGYAGESYTNKRVTATGMLQTSAVYSAIRLIAESCASLPLHLYRRGVDGDDRATDHDLYNKLNRKPHKYTTRQTFIESLAVSMCVWNQAYIKVNYLNGVGSRVISLQALPKKWVEPFFKDAALGEDLWYRVQEGSKQVEYPFGVIIPIRGFGHASDLEGISVPGMHRNAIGLSMAAEEYGSRFFGNGARPGGIMKTATSLSKDQREQLREDLERRFSGSENAHKTLVLEAGMEWESVQAANNSSQFIETRKNQVIEIARIFRVPPHKLFEMSDIKYNTVESENQAFVTDTLQSYLGRIEDALTCFLLTSAEQENMFFKFNIEGRLRADLKTRSESYAKQISWGVMSPNEARKLEHRKPKEGGDVLLIPLNTAPADLHAEILQKGGAVEIPESKTNDDKDDE